MKSKASSTIEDSVQRALAQTLDISEPRVSLLGGVAHLEGAVPSYQHKSMAADTVRLLTGASRVVNRLRVTPSRFTSDRTLQEAAQEALRTQLGGSADRLSVLVRQGIVQLKGKVASLADRCDAESAAWSVGGVIDVHNHVEVRGHTSSPESMARYLRQAVSHCLRLDISSLEVMARGDIVYLRGRVPSSHHRQAAEDLVRAHSQVREVVNELSTEEPPAETPPAQSRASA